MVYEKNINTQPLKNAIYSQIMSSKFIQILSTLGIIRNNNFYHNVYVFPLILFICTLHMTVLDYSIV